MSKNIKQIYDSSPITTNNPTDLMYFGQAPYGGGNDAAMLYSDFAAQFSTSGATATQVQQSAFNVGTDTGTANAHVVALSPVVSVYTNGLLVAFMPSANNTTNTPTLDVGPGAVTIVPPFTAQYAVAGLSPGDINTNQMCYVMYSNGSFILLNPYINNASVKGIQSASYTYAQDFSGSSTAYTVALNPPLDASGGFTGLIVCFSALAAPNTTTTPTLDAGFGPKPIVLSDFSALSLGDIGFDQISVCVYVQDSNHWILLNPINSYSSSVGVQAAQYSSGNDSGAADAYVVTLTPAVTSYTNGMEVKFTPANTSVTTTPTLNAGGGAKTIVGAGGAALSAGALSTTQLAYCVYSSALDKFMLLTPAA